jgi:hypothetical protein
MRQQINLYQPIFSEAKQPLSAATVSMLLCVVVAGLSAYSVYTSMRVARLASDVEVQRSHQTQIESELAAATAANSARSNPEEVEARVKQLSASLSERKKALELLQAGAAGQTFGFAARLEALARRHVDGIWIDRLVISGTNGSMSLAGATLNADIVPAYLQSLAHESVLAGTRFDQFVIESPAAAAVSADDSSIESKQAKERFIRFRAGNKALEQAKDQGPT